MNVIAGIGDAQRRASVEQLVFAALPPLSQRGRDTVRGLIETCGLGWPADRIARRLGFANRHALARLLDTEGLPPYRLLTHWILILGWVLEWEERRTPLFRQAKGGGRWPRAFRRVIQARTGLGWTEVRARGAMWVAAQLAEQCVHRRRPGAGTAAESPSAASDQRQQSA